MIAFSCCLHVHADGWEHLSVIERFCYDCHDGVTQKGDLNLEALQQEKLIEHTDAWEKVVDKLNSRQMPPMGKERPDEAIYQQVTGDLTTRLDAFAEDHPNPGRTQSFRRLTRVEYQYAIEDLLGLEIDGKALLPEDQASHGFDNVTVGSLSPTLLNRYITASRSISRLAVGASPLAAGGETYRVPADITQESQVAGLPVGTRGGTLIRHHFTHDAVYEFRIRLARDRNEEIEGLNATYQLDLLMDDLLVRRFKVAPPKIRMDYESVDRNLVVRVPVMAGLHEVGVTFVDHSDALLERKRRPYAVAFNMHRHPRLSPAIYQVSINGPYDIQGTGQTPSRQKIFSSYPTVEGEIESCAESILGRLMQRAYRRPVTHEDFIQPMAFFQQRNQEAGFEAGIESALSAILVSPDFLFKLELDPPNLPPATVYRLSGIELASRISYMLWSSLPDDALLEAAMKGSLRDPDGLEQQIRRMLRDPRSHRLASNFANQWLYLRNLDSLTPDVRLFPDFDRNLRQALRRETELFFESILREDRSVLDLLQCDYTYLNERLATHYGITGVHGSHFRRVPLKPEMHRGGLLRHGSVLSVTSYATRTSPVIRGHWVLENLLGVSTPPPPPDVPALEEASVDASLPVRARLAQHRADAACARCHDVMDPVGFALENFDAVGRWRQVEHGQVIDASGGLPDGNVFIGVAGLETALLERPELFVRTLVSKLLTFALGRGVEFTDAPAIRKIVQASEKDKFRMSAVILSIVQSLPFQSRKTNP